MAEINEGASEKDRFNMIYNNKSPNSDNKKQITLEELIRSITKKY
jgi:hypothetical protein